MISMICQYCYGRGCLACRGKEIRANARRAEAQEWLNGKIVRQGMSGSLIIRLPENPDELIDLVVEAIELGERKFLGILTSSPNPSAENSKRFEMLEMEDTP